MALPVDTRHDTTRATTPQARENMAQTDKFESARPRCQQKAQVCRSGRLLDANLGGFIKQSTRAQSRPECHPRETGGILALEIVPFVPTRQCGCISSHGCWCRSSIFRITTCQVLLAQEKA